MAEGKITFTFKGLRHPEQPWLVVSADSALELADTITSLGLDPVQALQAVGSTGAVAGAIERATQNLTAGGLNPSVAPENTPPAQAYQPPPAAAPQAPQPPAYQPPAQQQPWGAAPSNGNFAEPTCHHGARQHRSGTGRTGKPWAAWMCPSPKGTPDQCDPIWDRDPEYVAPF